MKIRLTISGEDGGELVSQIFEIAGRNDYQQASNSMWDRLREKLAKKAGDDSFWNDPFGRSEKP
jgi:hypothetical protein